MGFGIEDNLIEIERIGHIENRVIEEPASTTVI